MADASLEPATLAIGAPGPAFEGLLGTDGGRHGFSTFADRAVMVVEVTGGATPKFGKPQVLFKPSADIAPGIGPGNASVSRDGERFVIAVPRPQLRQLTVYDRAGKVISKVGEPGFYNQPNISPDATRAVVMRVDPRTGNNDIWTMDLASGKGTPITNDTDPQNAPIWSPDGKQVAYVSTHESISSIYRKAADGTGEAVQVFNYTPGAGMVLTDWSSDNKFMTFHTGVIVLVPLAGQKASDRKEIDWLREDYDAGSGRFSPEIASSRSYRTKPTWTKARSMSGRSMRTSPTHR